MMHLFGFCYDKDLSLLLSLFLTVVLNVCIYFLWKGIGEVRLNSVRLVACSTPRKIRGSTVCVTALRQKLMLPSMSKEAIGNQREGKTWKGRGGNMYELGTQCEHTTPSLSSSPTLII